MKKITQSLRKIITSAAFGLLGTAALSVPSYADEVDVLIIYDNEMNDHYNGSPNTAILNMVTTANTYYRNSEVDIQLNLVGSQLIEIDDDLRTFRDNNTVQSLRESTGADFVTYISGSYSGGCGSGYLTVNPRWAFSLIARGCMNHSYVHELGHNMGLGHSVAQDSTGSIYDYGIGYGVNRSFSTIMAYSSAYNVSRRTYLLSNPDYTCNGFTCGQENVADSARALNNVKTMVADFRESQSQSTGNNGDYVSMRKQNAQSFAIDGANGGANAQNTFLWTYSSTNINQHWIEIDRGNGYYAYQKRGTDFCLDGGRGGQNGQTVYLWTCSINNQNQHWRKVNISGRYRLEKRNAPGFSIDGGRGGASYQNVYLWSSNSANPNQQWIFTNEN